MSKINLKLDQPVYTGACILSLSKMVMMDFHYNAIKKEFNNDVSLCYMDTDSLIYEFKKSCNYWEKLKKLSEKFLDTSVYKHPHPLSNIENKNNLILGFFKDEYPNSNITSAIFLRAKQYSLQTKNIGEKKISEVIKAKGVSKSKLNYNLFKCVLDCGAEFKTGKNEAEFYTNCNSIRSYNHKITVISAEKKSLSAFDNKRYIDDDGINTYAFGHYLLK